MDSTGATLTNWARWRYAAKPASWPKLLVPAAFGQLVGLSVVGVAAASATAVVGAALFGAVFTLFDLLAIVFLNDWGDREVDAIKRRMFPDGCSPKTIPDGLLPARALLVAGLAAVAGLVVTAAVGAALLGRPLLMPFGLAAALVFQAYSFAPLRLNYRGGGEVLEALGVGLLLPWIGAYAQSGVLWHACYWSFVGSFVLSFGSALASGLSDEVSDVAGGKRTFATTLGNARTRFGAWCCLPLGALAWSVAGVAVDSLPVLASLGAALVVSLGAIPAWRASRAAVTNAFAAQAQFKLQLHLSIWWGMAVIAVLVVVCSDRG